MYTIKPTLSENEARIRVEQNMYEAMRVPDEIFITERIVNERLRLLSEHKEPTTLYLGGKEYHDLLSFIHMSDQQCRSTSSGEFFEGLKIKRMNKKSHFEFGYEDYQFCHY